MVLNNKKLVLLVLTFFTLIFIINSISAFTVADCQAKAVGGNITLNGDWCVYTFNYTNNANNYTTDSFNVTSGSLDLNILVVGGGGGAGGGGGGAGGVIYKTSFSATGNVPVSVGLGGWGGATNSKRGLRGYNSSFGNQTAIGGGGGGAPDAGFASPNANNEFYGTNGGSGGGCGGYAAAETYMWGGNGTSGQGYNGGTFYPNFNPFAGGGGSSQNGTVATDSAHAGYGGNGTQYNITGVMTYYGAGGGGGTYSSANSSVAGKGGLGGAGNGSAGGTGTSAVNGTGSGGGGGRGGSAGRYGGSGGTGIVIVTYQLASADTTYPQFTDNGFNLTNNTQYNPNLAIRFNITITNTNGTAGIQFNGTNYSLSNSSSEFYFNKSNLGAGTYFYLWWAYGNGTTNNFNSSSTYSYTIAKNTSAAVYTYLNNSRTNMSTKVNTAVYLNSSLFTVTGTLNLYYNGTLINTGSSVLSNLTNFNSTGLYNITGLYYGDSNYSGAYETWWMNVTPDITPPYFVTIPANATLMFGNNLNVGFNATDETMFGYYSVNDSRFFINQSGWLNNTISLGASIYLLNISINDTSGNINYTIYKVNVSKSNDLCDVIFNTTSPQAYPYKFKVYSNCTSTFYITRNGTIIANNSEQSLSAGSYNFTVYRNDSINYTNTIDTHDFTINKASSLVYAYLNNSRANISIYNGTSIYLNATKTIGEGDAYLYYNGTLINQGGVNVSNLTSFNFSGIYNVTTVYYATANYSGSYETWWVNVSILDLIYPQFSNYYDNSYVLNSSGIGNFNVTLNNTNGTVFLNINGLKLLASNLSSTVYNVSHSFTAGTYIYTWSSYGNGINNNLNISIPNTFVVNSSVIPSGGSGGSEGSEVVSDGRWVLLNYTNISATTLYSVDENHDTQWSYDILNSIEVKTKDINGSLIDIDEIKLKEINGKSFTYIVTRTSKGVYNVSFKVTNRNITTLAFELTVRQGTKTVIKNIAFGDVVNRIVSNITGNVIGIGKSLEDWFNKNPFPAIFLIGIIAIVFIGLAIIRRLK